MPKPLQHKPLPQHAAGHIATGVYLRPITASVHRMKPKEPTTRPVAVAPRARGDARLTLGAQPKSATLPCTNKIPTQQCAAAVHGYTPFEPEKSPGLQSVQDEAPAASIG